MRVLAKFEGFYDGNRRRAGTEFDISDAAQLPKWAVLATDEARQAYRDGVTARDKKMIAGALAASSEGVARDAVRAKAARFSEATNRSTIGKPLTISGGEQSKPAKADEPEAKA